MYVKLNLCDERMIHQLLYINDYTIIYNVFTFFFFQLTLLIQNLIFALTSNFRVLHERNIMYI